MSRLPRPLETLAVATVLGWLVLLVLLVVEGAGGTDNLSTSPRPVLPPGPDAIVEWSHPDPDDVAEVRIYYSQSPDPCRGPDFVSITDLTWSSMTSRYEFAPNTLTSGSWHFSLTALDAAGNESECSTTVTKEIP